VTPLRWALAALVVATPSPAQNASGWEVTFDEGADLAGVSFACIRRDARKLECAALVPVLELHEIDVRERMKRDRARAVEDLRWVPGIEL
jgi:hypothetical protein